MPAYRARISCLIVFLLSCLAAHSQEEPAKAQEQVQVQVRKQDTIRVLVQEETPAERRQRVRDERLEQKRIAWAVRDSARRSDNLVLGIAMEPTSFTMDYQGTGFSTSTLYSETMPVASFGYRTHFLRALGWQGGLKFASASGKLLGLDDCSGYGNCFEGYAVTGEGRLLIGPYGRFVLEPMVGYTMGRFTEKNRYSSSVDHLRYKFSTANTGFYMSFYFGRTDYLSLTFGGMFGVGTDASQSSSSMKLAFAFIPPKAQ